MNNTIDIAQKLGTEVIAYITSEHKYKIFVKSKPYNARGAYWPLQSSFISETDALYNALNQEGIVIDLYVDYYNNIKNDCEKMANDMPQVIDRSDIHNIYMYILPSSYTPYFM